MVKALTIVILFGGIFISCLLSGCVGSDYNPDSKRDNQPWNEGSHSGQGLPGFGL